MLLDFLSKSSIILKATVVCSNPRVIPNPAYQYGKQVHFRHTDDISPTITVPCGCCKECNSLKSQFISQRLEQESLTHYIYYFTFTCDDEHIVSQDFNGKLLYRYPTEVLTKCIKRFRNSFPDSPLDSRDYKYYYVTEYGSSKHRPHVHGFFCLGKLCSDDPATPFQLLKYIYNYWKFGLLVNVGSDSHPVYKSIYTYAEKFCNGVLMRNFDMQFVQVRGDSDFGSLFYINKYLYKLDNYVKYMYNVIYDYYNNPPQHTDRYTEFVKCWNLFRPRARKSLLFGFPNNYVDTDMVNSFAEESLSRGLDYPSYISPYSGCSRPLSPYYRKYISPSLLDKFTRAEYDKFGFITSQVLEPHSEPNFQLNLFDFTDIFY